MAGGWSCFLEQIRAGQLVQQNSSNSTGEMSAMADCYGYRIYCVRFLPPGTTNNR